MWARITTSARSASSRLEATASPPTSAASSFARPEPESVQSTGSPQPSASARAMFPLPMRPITAVTLASRRFSDYSQGMPDAIARVRRFNRTVTQRAGALEAGFLGLGRPLGAARVLWEIGPEGCEVRELRRRLALDSGYLSRLLRGLEADGLVTVAPARPTGGAASPRSRPRAAPSARSSTRAATRWHAR